MKQFLKRRISRLPLRSQQALKRLYYGYQLRNGSFKTGEQEFNILSKWVVHGDWVLDIGANIGHYTCRLSELVGINGRVIALEPVSESFELLVANTARLALRNITLLNAAASDVSSVVGMDIPKFDTGLNNYYTAHITKDSAKLSVLSLAIDGLDLPHPIKLVKIDAEGHELFVLKGMKTLLDRDYPILIIEDTSLQVISYLESRGYLSEKLVGSNNRIFQYKTIKG